MTRLIKRYGSRKLYDTKESRYVSLEDIAKWVRDGEVIQVVDNATSEDVTVQTLTQVISEEGRKGGSALPSDLLHDLIRVGGSAVTDRVKKIQTGVDTFFKKSIDRLVPVSKVREEMDHLRQRLDELETAISSAEAHSRVEMEETPAPVETTKTEQPAKATQEPAKEPPAAESESPKAAQEAKETKPTTKRASTRRSSKSGSSTSRRSRSKKEPEAPKSQASDS